MEERQLLTLLYDRVQSVIKVRKLDLPKLQQILREEEDRVRDLLQGKLENFTSDCLYNYLLELSPDVDFQNTCL